MGEPRRWTLGDAGADELLVMAGPQMELPMCVREDRATEADIEKVGFGLAKIKGEASGYESDEPGVRLWFDEHARDLLSLVFGEEATDV